MLTVVIEPREYFDERISEFVNIKGATIQVEHSLVSVSKWESKWHKSFLSDNQRTEEETIDYVRCMTLTQNVDPEIYRNLSAKNIADIQEYINAPMTATWFNDRSSKARSSKRVITSELIYCWMITLGIPMECQKWHLNRLLTLIRVCDIENSPKKKMSKNELLNSNRSLNAARKAALGTKG